ncbi:MAG: S-layer homology domain-containing protein [Clostridia bacterium]|nr:S-layer homology domain-containing protein [Clostridia bacterium]
MKKLIRIPLILILICCLSCSYLTVGVSAASNKISLSTRFDVDSSKLYISGTINSEKGNIPVIMTFSNQDGEVIAADQSVTNYASEGEIKFSFDPIPFAPETPSGDYKIYVSAAYINEDKTEIYTYIGPDSRFDLVQRINEAVKGKDKNGVVNTLSDYRDVVTDGDNSLFSLSSNAKSVFAKQFIAKGKYEIPEGYAEDEDIELLKESVKKISSSYKDALCFGEAVDISNKAGMQAWLDKYAEERGLFEDSPETEYNEADLKAYFDKAISNDGLYDRVSKAAKAAKDFAELKDEILKAGVLEALQEAKPAVIQEIVENNTDLLPVDIENFNKLKATQKVEVCKELTNDKFSNVEDFVKKFDDTVNDIAESGSDSSSGSSKSSSKGGGKGGNYTSTQTAPINTKDAVVSSATSDEFADLEDCEWAKEAVGYLASKSVVSGKANGVFDPFTPVTRAEFTKMVVLAFGIPSESYEGNFSDVSESDWFAPYVAAAYKSGVVNGMGDGTFDPNALITRQDMAVLLYRAKGMSPLPEEKDVYYDSENISDYAKSAVFALYFNGIALGYGDGTFGPLNNATRAEAAQMIYKMVTFDK